MKHILVSFRSKLLLSFLICSLVPLLLCCFLLVYLTGSRLNIRDQENMATQMENVLLSADQIRSGLQGAADALEQDPVIQKVLRGQKVEETAINSSLYAAARPLQYVSGAYLYDLQGKLLYSTRNAPDAPRLSSSWGVLRSARAARGTPVFQIPTVKTEGVLLQGAVLLHTRPGIPGAYLIMEMQEGDFYHLFNGKHGLTDGLLIVNSFFHPVYASSPELAAQVAPMLRSQLFTGSLREESGSLFEIRQHEGTGLYLILQRPQSFSHETMVMMYAISILCLIFCVLVSLLIYFPLSKQISAPISRIQKAFQKLGQDDLEVRLPTERQDELGQLARDFNRTVKALSENRQALIENQKDLNQAQIRLLQTQLNPHFLCNTLDTMKWISKIHKVPEVAEMSANLADILRYCITADEFVPLRKEVDFLGRYMDIQKIRVGDKMEFLVDLPPELSDCMVPKMILQPIVENAVLHGLRDTGKSTIRLTIRTVGKLLEIIVTDNGPGLPEDLIGKSYVRPPAPNGHHLGLYNVNTILRKHYGEGSGLYLDRGPGGQGTSVTATLPIEREDSSHA